MKNQDLLLALIIVLMLVGYSCDKYLTDKRHEHDLRVQRIKYEDLLTFNEVQMRDYFMSQGSPVPNTMAKAVGKSKRKYLAAAIAAKESNGNPKAIGDHGSSLGAYQVQPKHWGRVPKSAHGQTAQHDWVMDQLIAEVGPKQAVKNYNGKGPAADRYQKSVTKEAIRLSQEMVE